MPEINNSEIPVNPSRNVDFSDERREESNTPLFAGNYRLIELNPVVPIEDWKRKLHGFFLLTKQTIDLGKIKEVISKTVNDLTRDLAEIKESINLSNIKKELLSNIKLKGYRQWKV